MSTEIIIAISGIVLSAVIGIYQIVLSKKVKDNKIEIQKIINHNSNRNSQNQNSGNIIGNSNNGNIEVKG